MYSLMAAVGDSKLLPEPDHSCIVINGDSGCLRENKSWILGRLVRDYESWMHPDVRQKVEFIIDSKWLHLKSEARCRGQKLPERPIQAGLCVSIYESDDEFICGQKNDMLLYLQSIVIAIAQIGIAATPCAISGDWGVLAITVCGIALSSATASLTHWRYEKWACRRLQKKSKYVLTSGNGNQHVIVILGDAGFLDLEDLASGQPVRGSVFLRWIIGSLTLLWGLLLIFASGIKDNSWYLLAIGTVGIIFNVYVAGVSKDPRCNGLPVKLKTVLGHRKVMQALYLVEEEYPGLGRNMRDVFFPGGELRPQEKEKWTAFEEARESHRSVTNQEQHSLKVGEAAAEKTARDSHGPAGSGS